MLFLSSERSTRYNQQVNLSRNYLYAFFKDFSFFTAVIVPFFTDWGHLSLLQVQLIQSWFSFWVFVLEIPTGAVADKIGRKTALAIGSSVTGLAVLIYGTFPSIAIFLVAEFLFALGYTLTSGADQALLYDTLKEKNKEGESKKVLGRADAFHKAGIMLAAPFGSLIAAQYGINAPMLSSAIPFFIAAIIGWSITEPRVNSESQSPKYGQIVKKGFQTIRHNKVVRTLAIDSLLVSGAAYFLIWLNQPLQLFVGIPVSYLGFTYALMMGIEILVLSNFTFFEKILGTGNSYIKKTALLTSLGFFAAAITPSYWTVALFILLVGGFGYTRATYITSIANKYISSTDRATVLSSISMLRRFAIVMLNPVIGFAADHSLSLALFLVGLLPLATFLIKEEIE